MFEPDSIETKGIEVETLELEEVFLDIDAKDVHRGLESTGFPQWGVNFFSIAVLVGVIVILGRLLSVQIYKGNEFLAAAEGNRIRTLQKFAPRGRVLDRYGEVLARNVPSFQLVAIVRDLPNDSSRGDLFSGVARITDMKEEDIENLIAGIDADLIEPVTIKQNLTQDEALALEDVVARGGGFQIQNRPVREYVDGRIFQPILGYVGKINKEEWLEKRKDGYYYNDILGKTGVEYVYEKDLRGVHGGARIEVDVEGGIVKELQEIPALPGDDLHLTIDYELQKVIYNSLEKMLKSRPGATGAAAVAMNPKNGEILSLVSLPTFDNNLFARGIKTDEYQKLISDQRKPMLNRVLSGTYPPGSIVKPLIGAAALEEGVITTATKIKDTGVVQVGEYSFYGWKRDGLGVMDIISAIAQSSDPFFYVVGGGHPDYKIEGLGIDRLVKYYRAFNFGRRTDINLPGEDKGFVPTPEWKKTYFAGTDEANWYLGNTYHLSIGQGYLLATPLQIAVYTSAIANHGKIMKPLLTNREQTSVVGSVPIGEANLVVIRKAMRENVVSGSGVRLSTLKLPVAGKTGSAQFDAKNPDRTHAWYTGFAPSDDPQIVVTALVEGGGEGHAAAVPVVKDALEWWDANR